MTNSDEFRPAVTSYLRMQISPGSQAVTTALKASVLRSSPMAVSAEDFRVEDLEQYRRELTGYCYRMLGSVFEADDAVQDTMVRAWRAMDSFEGR